MLTLHQHDLSNMIEVQKWKARTNGEREIGPIDVAQLRLQRFMPSKRTPNLASILLTMMVLCASWSR